MLYGDLGRVPLSIGIKKRAVGFCYDMILSKDKLSSIIHFMMLFIILIDITGYILFNPYLMNVDLAIFGKVSLQGSKSVLLCRLDVILKSQFIQKRQSDINMSTKCANYRMFKVEHKFEKYLDILEGKFLNSFINFRICNNYLPVEKGRWYRQDLINRQCRLCNLNEIGDEFHYLFKCLFYRR